MNNKNPIKITVGDFSGLKYDTGMHNPDDSSQPARSRRGGLLLSVLSCARPVGNSIKNARRIAQSWQAEEHHAGQNEEEARTCPMPSDVRNTKKTGFFFSPPVPFIVIFLL